MTDTHNSSGTHDHLATAAHRARLDDGDLGIIRTWIADQLAAQQFAKLGQGGHTQNQVHLRQVFVDLPVGFRSNLRFPHEPPTLFLSQLLSSPPLENWSSREWKKNYSKKKSSPKPDDARSPAAIRVRRSPHFSSTLLIGGPGQGKSTLGQLACQIYRAILLEPAIAHLSTSQAELVQSFSQRSTKGLFSTIDAPIEPLFPIQVLLPDLAVWLAKHNDSESDIPAIFEFLTDLPSARKVALTAEHLASITAHLPSLVVLDGFDEVGATHDRERLILAARELLHFLAERRQSVKVVATTRPQGYAGELERIGIELRTLYLLPLERDEALEYAARLVEAKIPDADAQTKILDRLREAAREQATARLLSTPLQVTILTALVQQLGRAPRERWNLFSRYFAYTYDREVERETYASRLLAEHRAHIEQIHTRIGLLLQVEGEKDGGASARISQARFKDVIESVLLEDEVSDEDRRQLVTQIAVAAEQRLVFLVEPEPGSFGFEVRSIQEFLAAWAITSGRDAEIEARIRHIAKASMFRNVLLFVASKLFSEASPLRDVLSESICQELDSDSNDELSRITKAGSILALEVLEEGAVLAQPKRARSLMERATGILSLASGPEHARLSRIANSDTAAVLATALEERIFSQGEAPWKKEASLACVAEGLNTSNEWAAPLFNRYASTSPDPSVIISICARTEIAISEDIARFLDAEAHKVDVGDLIDCHLPTSITPTEPATWTSWIMGALGSEEPWTRREPIPGLTMFRAEPIRQHPEPSSPSPTAWKGWIDASRFEVAPSAATLADALDSIADSIDVADWNTLRWTCAWPLTTCLSSADSPQELRAFAAKCRSGALGDFAEWATAESSWGSRAFSPTFGVSEEDLPWNLSTLSLGPPAIALSPWIFDPRYARRALSSAEDWFKRSMEAFSAANKKSLKKKFADICIFLSPSALKDSKIAGPLILEWIRTSPQYASVLLVKPKWLPKSSWIRILEDLDSSKMIDFTLSPDDAARALIESKAHRIVVNAACNSIMRHFRRGEWNSDKYEKRLTQCLDAAILSTPESSAKIGMLKLVFGISDESSDQSLLESIKAIRSEQEKYWQLLSSVTEASRASDSRSAKLQAAAYAGLTSANSSPADPARALKEIFQKTKSEISSHAVWNRLALPLPRPVMTAVESSVAGIPSSPILIHELSIKNVCGLHELKLSFPQPKDSLCGQWIVILGENGTGKTTLLKSIALSLRNTADLSIWPKGLGATSWNRFNAEGETTPESTIAITLSDSVVRSVTIRSDGYTSINQVPALEATRACPLFAYGCRRGSALGGISREVDLNREGGPEIATLFDERADLVHAETWLLQLQNVALEANRASSIFDSVLQALRVFLDLSSIEVTDRRVWVAESGRARIPFSSLSDGYLTSAGWFLDLIARWLALAEEQRVPVTDDFLSNMTGLVLLDEIDMHLHPRWQVEIIARTRALLPRMTFVTTTHNPLALVGARADEIWILARNEDNGQVTARSGDVSPLLLTGGQIYRQYFGLNDIYPSDVGRNVARLSFLSGYALRNDDEEREVNALKMSLAEVGIDPSWPIVPRTILGGGVQE